MTAEEEEAADEGNLTNESDEESLSKSLVEMNVFKTPRLLKLY